MTNTPDPHATPGEGTPQPVAWANEDDDGTYEVGLSEAHAHYVLERAANGKYSHRNPRIVPLYRQPQPTLIDLRCIGGGTILPLYRQPQPTLTDEEREAISAAACICEDADRTDIAIIVNTALERLG